MRGAGSIVQAVGNGVEFSLGHRLPPPLAPCRFQWRQTAPAPARCPWAPRPLATPTCSSLSLLNQVQRPLASQQPRLPERTQGDEMSPDLLGRYVGSALGQARALVIVTKYSRGKAKVRDREYHELFVG